MCDNCSYEQASLSLCCFNCKDNLRLPQLDGNDSVSSSSSNSSSSLSLCFFNYEDSVSSSSNSTSSPSSLLSSLNLTVDSDELSTVDNCTNVNHSSGDLNSEMKNIIQLDGNDTLDTTDASIETIATVDEQSGDQYSSIPKIYSAIARSLFPKYIMT